MKIELLETICQKYDLGSLQRQPLPLTGGFLHTMISLFAANGNYAIKLLNPYIMQRETAMENYRIAEELETLLVKNKIPVLPALIFNNKKMQCIDNQYFYLYEWYDGKALKKDEIKEMHCLRMGQLLAHVHNIDQRHESKFHSPININWDYYLELLVTENEELYQLIKKHRSLLYESQNNGNAAIRQLPAISAICHNDLDSKNVLWIGTDCRIIDLECLSYSNPFMELYETSLCWSGFENYDIDYNLLTAFVRAYAQAGGQLPSDWETLYYSSTQRLAWLEYNLKRSLGIECAAEEISVGVSEVKKTIAQVCYYHQEKNHILHCLRQILAALSSDELKKG